MLLWFGYQPPGTVLLSLIVKARAYLVNFKILDVSTNKSRPKLSPYQCSPAHSSQARWCLPEPDLDILS